MALGILEPAEKNVPGTVNVLDETQRHDRALSTNTTLKRDKTGKIILSPQPSSDPNDPLNWPVWQRDVILTILCLVSTLATTASPLLAADSVQLALRFKRTFEEAAWLTAWNLLGVGIGALVFVPSARVWGKRHVFLFGAILMVISSAWGGSTHHGYSYKSLLWARVIQGLALAPFESLVNACVGDLYFVHERGPRMAFVNTALFGGAFLTPVFVGMIAKHMGWWWSFYLLAIFMSFGFLALFFFVPETAFARDEDLNTDILADRTTSGHELSSTPSSEGRNSEDKHLTMTSIQAARAIPARKTFAQRLSPFDGRKTNENFFKLFLRPFPLALMPSIIWGCLVQGVIIGWTVMVGVILSLIFLGPPLFFDEERAGKMYTAAFIGSMIGLVLSGLFSEVTTRWLIKKNHGRYEPEFRIVLLIPTLVFAAIGLYGFGITAANTYKYGWLVPEVFLAFIIASMVMGAIGAAQYLLDAHREIAVETFTILIVFKNIFSFVLAYFAYTWVFAGGIRRLFIIFGSIEVAICCLSLPMYVLGKRNRAFFHHNDLLKMTGLK